MQNKWEAFRGSIGFYATMAVCLAVIGVSGYFLLADGEDAPVETEPPTVDLPAAAPVTTIREPEEPTPVEVLSPGPVEEPDIPVSMPEVSVDPAPVSTPTAAPLVVSPLKGEVLAAFSVDELVYDPTLEDWRIHDGIDISAKPGTTVLAACAGTVLAVTDDALMGTTVTLSHADGYQTTYANLQSRPTVEIGDTVKAGQIIGAVGTTAAAESAQSPHLHFSVTKDGDVVDPNAFLKR